MTTEQTITIDGKVISEYTVRFWMKQIESISKENNRLTRLAREMVEGIERMTSIGKKQKDDPPTVTDEMIDAGVDAWRKRSLGSSDKQDVEAILRAAMKAKEDRGDEITAAMKLAGVAAQKRTDLTTRPYDKVCRIYRAMTAARESGE